MENTALNGTATKDHEDWKKKKGYGPIIVAVSLALLLGLSFYMGGHFDVGTNLPPNVAASSSSMSLVGSGTATSDLKTLTLTLDDDDVIDGLLSGWMPKGGGGNAGDKCTETSDCNTPDGLDHPVCRNGKCQRGVCKDYCGQDSDCISGYHCIGQTNIAKCKYSVAYPCG